MEIRRLGPTDVERVMAASSLFDGPVSREWASLCLAREGHHMLFAYINHASAGFVSGVEMTHPHKGTEMFLNELSVAEEYRGRGAGRALVAALSQLAAERSCYGMWVGTEPGLSPPSLRTKLPAPYTRTVRHSDVDVRCWPLARQQ